MKKFWLINALLVLVSFFLFIPSIQAEERQNNIFGIHLAQPHLNEIKKVAELVNNNGGDWGYVTLVMQENDRSHQKWQEIFDLLREFHLIPIIRVATIPEGENWRRPSKNDATSWAEFLNSLNWVVKNRYIVLFNEPNHGSEWGGEVDTNDFATVVNEFAKKLKEKSPDFFIMLAGLDASAPSYATTYKDAEIFLRETINSIGVDQFNKLFSGLSSHSYPNPGFSASPYNYGRKSIHTYQWELEILQSLGVKDLPVFITETGWSASGLSRDTIAQYFQIAYSDWLNDKRIIAVTPFVYDYQGAPFLEFSWKKFQSEDFYPQYYTVQAMAKIKGSPEQIDKGDINLEYGPYEIVSSSSYRFHLKIKNTGQAIWDKTNGYDIKIINNEKGDLPFDYLFSDLPKIKPFQDYDIQLMIKTKAVNGRFAFSVALYKNEQIVAQIKNINMEIVPLPNLDFRADFYPKLNTTDGDFEIQIFDEKEGLIYKKNGIRVKNGWGVLDEIQNIAIGKKYRVVLLRPYYLPRQDYVSFKRGSNVIKFKRMYPLDFNVDGHFDWNDFGALLNNFELFSLLLP